MRTICSVGFVLMVLTLTACSTVQQSTTHGLSTGKYVQVDPQGEKTNVYAEVDEDSIHLYPLKSIRPAVVDPHRRSSYNLYATSAVPMPRLTKTSLDVDVSTAIFKYRFARQGVPNQLSANLNANIYAGWRRDYFSFHDNYSPTGKSARTIQHFEFDMGIFAGLGTTAINPTTTSNHVNGEYDGMIFQKGIALFMGVQRLTLGLGLGFDTLLDNNRTWWIYNQQPWLGLLIGLNLSD
jgi:hypothetical protein